MIRLSIFFAVIGSLQLFDIVVPLTGGGPFDTTHTMVSFLYYFGITRIAGRLRLRRWASCCSSSASLSPLAINDFFMRDD